MPKGRWQVNKFAEKNGHPDKTVQPSRAPSLLKVWRERRRCSTDWTFPQRLARIRGDRWLGRAAFLRPRDRPDTGQVNPRRSLQGLPRRVCLLECMVFGQVSIFSS